MALEVVGSTPIAHPKREVVYTASFFMTLGVTLMLRRQLFALTNGAPAFIIDFALINDGM